MSVKLNLLRKLVRELIKKELEEATMTGNIDGGAGPPKTPLAFKKKKKGQDESGLQDGHVDPTVSTSYRKVKESVNEDKGFDLAKAGKVDKIADEIIKNMKLVKALHLKGKNKEAKVVLNNKVYSDLDYIGRAFRILGESRLNENDQSWAKYYSWRNDKSMTPKQKIGMSMREVRDSLQELEKIVFRSIKLKKELKVGSDNYWKSTHSALRRIHERLVKLTGKIANLY